MATTTVMEGEDIGGLTRRHFIGLVTAGALAITGGAWLVSRYSETTDSSPSARAEHTEPKWLGMYVDMRKKYDKQIEQGKIYVNEKYGIVPSDLRLAVFDEVHHCEQGIMSPPCPIQEGIFVAYTHPNGYIGLIVGNDGKIMEYGKFNFPSDPKKREALEFFGEQTGGLEDVMVSSIMRIKDGISTHSEVEKKPEDDYFFRIDTIIGWNNGRGTTADRSYIVDTRERKIEPIRGL